MEIKLNPLEIQTGKLGRPFKLVGTKRDSTQPPKWIGKSEKFCCIHLFRYQDENRGDFKVYENYIGELNKL